MAKTAAAALPFVLLFAACAHDVSRQAPEPGIAGPPRAAVQTEPRPVAAAPARPPEPVRPAPPAGPPPTIATDPNGSPITVLVMPLHTESSLKGSAHALDEMILGAIGHYKRYQVMGPDDLNAMLGVEKLKDAMGCDDVSCAAEIGGALGAPYIVTGELTRLGEEVVLSLRLLDAKKSRVMARGTARGGLSADDMTQVMEQAVGEAFNIKVSDVAHAHSSHAAGAEAPTQMGLTYQAVMNQLSKRAANKDYPGLMQDLDSYGTQTIYAPPGTDVREVLAFWRCFACFMAQKPGCVTKAAKAYQEQWPDGMYASTVKSYTDQLALLERQRAAREQLLEAQMEQIEVRRRAGQISDDQALEMSAGAAMGALAYQRAAVLYEQLMNRSVSNEQRWFAFAEQRAVALEENQAYAQARVVLQQAQLRNSQLFRSRGMGLILARLPP